MSLEKIFAGIVMAMLICSPVAFGIFVYNILRKKKAAMPIELLLWTVYYSDEMRPHRGDDVLEFIKMFVEAMEKKL